MHKDQDKVGTGDIRIEQDLTGNESTVAGSRLPGTPGYVGESSQRHHEFNEETQPEIRSTQLMPGPLDEREDATSVQIEPEILKWNQDTKHTSR